MCLSQKVSNNSSSVRSLSDFIKCDYISKRIVTWILRLLHLLFCVAAAFSFSSSAHRHFMDTVCVLGSSGFICHLFSVCCAQTVSQTENLRLWQLVQITACEYGCSDSFSVTFIKLLPINAINGSKPGKRLYCYTQEDIIYTFRCTTFWNKGQTGVYCVYPASRSMSAGIGSSSLPPDPQSISGIDNGWIE